MLTTILKRDGEQQEFFSYKIEDAIKKAFKSENIAYNNKIFFNVLENLKYRKILSVEDIQDLIEQELYKEQYFDVMRSFMLYRHLHKLQREKLIKEDTTYINSTQTIEEYIFGTDWRIKANSNTGYSNAGLVNNTAGKVIANYWLDKIYLKEEGYAHRNGDYHIHDLDCLTGYCAGWSLRVLLDEGFNGVRGRVESDAPKHFREALGQMANFLGILQSEWAGAQAFSSFDTYLAPYVFKDELKYKDVKKAIRSFIYNLNVPARWGQSPFTNITIDWTVPQDLKDQIPTRKQIHLFKDLRDNNLLLEKAKKRGVDNLESLTYKHFQKEMNLINKAYYEVMTEGDKTGQPFTFPIPTVNITEDFDWYGENTDILFENTAKIGSSYFQNFIGSQYKRDANGNLVENEEAYKPGHVRSMCPLTPDTKLLVKTEKGISKLTIGEVVKYLENRKTKYKVWSGNKWCNAKPVKTPTTKVYEITLTNGSKIKMGEDHLQPIMNGDVISAKDLKVDMYLPYNKNKIDCNSLEGSYELGYAVGAFLGDGSIDNNGINYSLSTSEKDNETEEILTNFWSSLGYRITTKFSSNNVRNVRIGSNSYEIINRYITGKYAIDKGMNNIVFNSSITFRNGLKDGLIATDGSRDKRRISTSSINLRDDIIRLFTSLGLKSLISYVDNREEGRLGDNFNYMISYPQRGSYGNYYKEDDKYHYYRITNIEEVNYTGKYLYCLEVDNEEHLFMLADGLITHNCRLQLDLRELLKRGGGLFGSAEMTGSLGVVTINMARLGFLYKGNYEALINRLDELMDMAKSTLEKKRVFIQDMYDKDLFPYTKRYLPHFNNHFSTIGVNGINEMIRNFTSDEFDISDQKGIEFALNILNHMREKMVQYQEETGNLYNLEATPAEGTTYRFAKEDKKRYGDSILQAGIDENIYYTNSSQIPVDLTSDPFTALDLQDELQCKYTGGTVLHLYMQEQISSIEACRKLVKNVISNYRLPYITITPLFSVCPKHGYIAGEYEYCPKCDEELLAQEIEK